MRVEDGDGRGGGEVVTFSCSFCGQERDKVKCLIAGGACSFICNECVQLCVDVLIESGIAVNIEPPAEEPAE